MTLHNHINHKSAGFTLLELLVVTAVLAVLAGAVISSYNGLQQQGQYDVAIYEMAEIRKALTEFRRDSGSNNFPGQGIYDCTDASNGGSSTAVNTNFAPMPSEAGSNAAERIKWCQHPANFWMLFINPFDNPATTNEEGGWNRDTKRGWNGPYLKRNAGYVDVGENIQPDGSGNPLTGSFVTDLWGIASPYLISDANILWRTQAGDSSTDLEQFGSPYFMFDLDDDGSIPTTSEPARIVSLGQDNRYDDQSGSSDCSQSIADDGFPVDHILCVLR